MHGRHLAAVLLLLAAPLTGCIGDDPSTNTADDEIEQASTGIENGTIETEMIDGEVVFSAATPAVTFNFNPPGAEGPFFTELERPENATGYVIEVTWEPSTPASETLDVWIRSVDEGNIPPTDPMDPVPAGPAHSATGSSPLKLAVAEDELEEDTQYEVIVRAPSGMGAGVTVDQPFTLHVSTFVDRAFDESFSAVENGTSAR